MINIGGFILTDDIYAPNVNISYEYFTTNSGVIIGGKIKATITGTVSISDTEDVSSKTGSVVMQRLAGIRDLGKLSTCIFVSIPNFPVCGGKARITNVSIDQGPDPPWVNQGGYTIELVGAVEEIPSNIFGIVASDGITEFSRDEVVELGEDTHGYIFDAKYGASKAFIKFTTNISIRRENLCCNPDTTLITLLRRLAKIYPLNPVLIEKFKDYTPYLQSRNFTVEDDGRATFTSEIIYVPKRVTTPAFVDLEFGHSRTYENDDETFTTSGTVVGLVNLSWKDNLINFTDTCTDSKLSNALIVYKILAGKYSDLCEWKGTKLELKEFEDCPKESPSLINLNSCRLINDDGSEQETDDRTKIKPSSSTLAISRTEGTINFQFEWSSITKEKNGGCFENGIKKETTIEIINPQPTIIEHVLPSRGTLLQNLSCNTAKKVIVTVSITYPEDRGSCDINQSQCVANDGLQGILDKYLNNLDSSFICYEHTITTTNNSYTIKQSYIEC